MSEERLERIENQLEQVIQAISGMQQNYSGMDQKISSVTYSHRQPLKRSGGGFSNSQMRFLASQVGYPLSLHKQQTTVQSSVLAH
jgi:hypothetical protein